MPMEIRKKQMMPVDLYGMHQALRHAGASVMCGPLSVGNRLVLTFNFHFCQLLGTCGTYRVHSYLKQSNRNGIFYISGIA